jgi:drug/metabolite transporter (DMT)-like permease
MSWFLIALGAPFLWAFVNIADKFLVDNYSGKEKSSGSLVLFSSLIGIVACIGIALFTNGFLMVDFFDRILLAITGILGICWVILYLFALEIEDVSTVVPWMLTIPVFGYFLGYIILGESLSVQQLIGGVVVLLGASILAFDFSGIKILFKKKIAFLMLLSCLIYSVNGVIFKFVTEVDSFWGSSFWEYLGLGVGGIFIFLCNKKYRNQFISNIKESGRKIFMLNISSEWVTIFGNLLTNYALLLAPVAMVYLVHTFQPVVVLFFTFLTTKFFPKVITEDFSLKVLFPKIVAIGIMIIGSIFLLR